MGNRTGTGGRAQAFWEAVGWTGLGLIGGGILLAIVDLVRFPTTAEGVPLSEDALWWLASVVLGGIVLWVVLRRVRWKAHAGPVEHQPPPGLTVFLVVVGLLSVYAAYAAFPGWAFPSTAEYDHSYRPDLLGVSLWVMTLVVASGTVLVLASAHRPRFRPVRRSAPFLAGGLVLVLVTDLGLRAATLHQPTEYTVTDAFPDTPAPVPTDVSEVGWTWEPPEGVSVETVEPGPFGPLMVLDDGVVAVDGASGDELWSYRHPYGEAWATVVDEGATAVVFRIPRPDRLQGSPWSLRATRLDTATGEVLREFDVPPPLPDNDGTTRTTLLASTSDVRIHEWNDPGEPPRVSARPVDGVDEVWSFTPPDDDRTCMPNHGWTADDNLLLMGDRVFVLYACTDAASEAADDDTWPLLRRSGPPVTVVVAALDVESGEVVWERGWEDPVESRFHLSAGRPFPTGDAHPVLVLESEGGWGIPRVLDPRDGTSVSELPPELVEPGTEMREDFEGLVRADSDGTVLLTLDREGRQGSGDRVPWEFHRASTAGEITGVAQVPYEAVGDDGVETTATVLGDSVAVLTDNPRSGAGGWNGLSAVVASFGSGSDGASWIALDEGGDLTSDGWETGARLVPVPGAVVAYVEDTETTVVHGLVG